MSEAKVDPGRRTWIAITCGAGAVGGVAVAVPFVSSFAPSERAKAAGAPVQVDISGLQPGREDDRRMARQAGVDRAPHARAAGVAAEDRRRSWPTRSPSATRRN